MSGGVRGILSRKRMGRRRKDNRDLIGEKRESRAMKESGVNILGKMQLMTKQKTGIYSFRVKMLTNLKIIMMTNTLALSKE